MGSLDKKILVTGRFNVLHAGHIRILKFAKELGGKLIVGVESDRLAGEHAYVNENLRLEGVSCNSWVDESFIFDQSITDLVLDLKPNVIVKGKEHELSYNPEQATVVTYGGQLLFSSGENIFSSVDLIRKEFFSSSADTINLPKEFFERHCIKQQRLVNILKSFSDLKVCVVGDLIIDEYITCQPLGMSQEDPTIVVTPIDKTKFIGGASIVAAHAAGLGANVDFISVTGDDEARIFAVDELANAGVSSSLLIDHSRPTTLKQRFRSKGKSLLRVSYLHQGAISLDLQKKILAEIEKKINKIDLFVFSDFNYGCLPQPMVEQIISLLNGKNITLVADSQSSSQFGDIGRFKGMDMITPTEHEARISTRDQEAGLVVLADILKQNSNARNILLKMGEEGLLIHAEDPNSPQWLTDRIDALNTSPRDVAGAGDSLMITAAMTMACGGNIWEAAGLGSIAAAIQVGRVGNTPLKIEEFLKELSR